MKVLYIGEAQTHEKYLRGIVPSHWLYGACEMEQDGHIVIWEQEGRGLWHDVSLIRRHRPDLVFIPNLNIRSHIFLLLTAALGLCRIPLYAYLHHGPSAERANRRRMYQFLLRGLSHLFFLSAKSMQEAIDAGWVKLHRCSLPGWGADRDFYQNVSITDKGYFVSTGKENRDFDTLIEAFRRTGAPLRIMTAKSHAGSDYSDLLEKTKNIPNITVCLVENSGDAYPQMLRAMAEAKALVCPLRQDRLSYCVGLSTIADAEGLKKPLIITRNPYHEEKRVAEFCVVESVDDWVEAIRRVELEEREHCTKTCSMQRAYEQMKRVMFPRECPLERN